MYKQGSVHFVCIWCAFISCLFLVVISCIIRPHPLPATFPAPSLQSVNNQRKSGITRWGRSEASASPVPQSPANDVKYLTSFLSRFGYRPKNTQVLVDDGESVAPTRNNMLDGMRELVAGARPVCSACVHMGAWCLSAHLHA